MVFGVVELVAGFGGLILAVRGRLHRASHMIAVGLLLMGLSHLVSGKLAHYLPDVGGFVILAGLGMWIGWMRRARRQSRSGDGTPPA